MGEMKKLSPEELAALREQIKKGMGNPEAPKAQAAAESYVAAPSATRAMSTKRIEISVAEDRMSATMMLADPGEEVYVIPELIGALRSRKIVIGIKSQVLMDMLADQTYNEPIVVAEGKPLVPSTEGYYEYFFDTEEHRTPEIREDGSTDYAAVGRLANVKLGDKIAQYHPATLGENGYDIMGNEKVVKPAKEKPALRGQYIDFKESTNEYFATRDGKISVKDHNIEILDVHEIKDNVTMIQGKVEFYGDLYIHGDIENGVVIRAGRNIVVDGTVGSAQIYAGGDIILQKGIQGGGKGKVSARGNIFSDFIEYANIEAGMDIYANSIINSNISTQGSVVVSGSHGSIIGGDTHGLRGITANAAGSETEVKTLLHAGFLESDYEKFVDLNQQEKKVTMRLEKLVDDITALFKASAKTKNITKSRKQEILLLNEKKVELQKQIDEIKSDKADISRKMSMGMGAAIVIRGDIYRNVVIKIDTATQYIWKNESYVKYVCKNESIERRTVPRD